MEPFVPPLDRPLLVIEYSHHKVSCYMYASLTDNITYEEMWDNFECRALYISLLVSELNMANI